MKTTKNKFNIGDLVAFSEDGFDVTFEVTDISKEDGTIYYSHTLLSEMFSEDQLELVE